MKYGTMSYLFVDGKVLMIKKDEREEDPNSGYTTLPGGELEEYEMGMNNSQGRLESVIRENEEETGLKLINPFLRGVILFDNKERIFTNWKNPEDFLVYIFGASESSGNLNYKSEEGKPLWVPEKEIKNLPKNSGDKKIYEWIKNHRFFMGTIYHRGEILDEEKTFVDYF